MLRAILARFRSRLSKPTQMRLRIHIVSPDLDEAYRRIGMTPEEYDRKVLLGEADPRDIFDAIMNKNNPNWRPHGK